MKEILHILTDALKSGVMITCLVLIMMLLIEYMNIENRGKFLHSLKKNPIKQVVTGAILGLVPGCVGGFAAVSLYTHGIIGLGALVAAMISSTGDEAFVIIATMPGKYPVLLMVLFAIALVAGLLINILTKREKMICKESYQIHSEDEHPHHHTHKDKEDNEAKPAVSRERIIIVTGITLFIIGLVTGVIDEDHEAAEAAGGFHLFSEKWLNILFAVVALITLLLTATAKEHFIKEHIWGHIIKKHLLSVFIWVFCALVICGVLLTHLDIASYIANNQAFIPAIILLAILIGLIPQSGPHMIFVLLCANGTLPMYILLVSSISQQGHVSLPLLAESKRSWLVSKGLCAGIALITGMLCWLITK